jgi:hypothetical protein
MRRVAAKRMPPAPALVTRTLSPVVSVSLAVSTAVRVSVVDGVVEYESPFVTRSRMMRIGMTVKMRKNVVSRFRPPS